MAIQIVKKEKTDQQCGYSYCSGKLFQKFANIKSFVIIHGILGCMYIATSAYFNGTITTIEKRYGISSHITGLILTGYDFAAIFSASLLSYYLARRHRPRWIARGMAVVAVVCLLIATLHLIHGPGDEALRLTEEYDVRLSDILTEPSTLCQLNSTVSTACENPNKSGLFPPIYLFCSQFIVGIFAPLYDSLGTSYIDDNMPKSKTPMLISISYTLRMFGPAIGYALASVSLSQYIAPELTPIISSDDSRWLGAWWLGWIVLFGTMIIFVFLVSLFPKEMRRSYEQRIKAADSVVNLASPQGYEMVTTFKRVLTNKVYMLNNLSVIFFYFGYLPYWMFTPKYIEAQYRQSASTSNLLTGSIAPVFTAVGFLLSGAVVSKLKPSARSMAAWNTFVGAISAFGFISLIFLGCSENDKTSLVNQPINKNMTSCMSDCHCDFVKYSPICGADGNTYISPCHAGCMTMVATANGTKRYDNCRCISGEHPINMFQGFDAGEAISGACPVDCFRELLLFIMIRCVMKFISATTRPTNLLISLRCVDAEDKTASVGVTLTMTSLFASIPSPIFYGWLIDQTCSVWGKTCTSSGNCWLYDGKSMRYFINVAAATAAVLGTICDCGLCFLVKDLVIFDKNVN